jgi:hypothetical protein
VVYVPRVFIGSSSAGKSIAAALAGQLEPQVRCRVWYKDTFAASRTIIESLEGIARSEVDVAVLVLTPDDITHKGRSARNTVRDNVIFELGLFMGALGRGRTFGVKCRHCEIDLPADLLGVTWVTFQHPHDVVASAEPFDVMEALGVAVAPAAREILQQTSGLKPEPIRAAGSPEIVKAYAMRGLVTRLEWNGMIRGTQNHLWLYGMAELGYAEDDDVPGILRSAADTGCDIRILLLDPAFPGVSAIDADEGNPIGTLASRVRAGLARFSRIRKDCGPRMQLKVYKSTPVVSIVRGDDRMLVTPYVRFLTGNNTPTLELRESGGSDMFERYTRHFENVWRLAEDWRE